MELKYEPRYYGQTYANISLLKIKKDINISLHLYIKKTQRLFRNPKEDITLFMMVENNNVYTNLEIDGFGFMVNC